MGTVQIVLVLCAFVAAIAWAEWPERASAAVMLVAYALDWLYHWLIAGLGVYHTIDPGHLVIDLFLLASFLAIALKADRQWCLWVAAAQVVALLGHPVRLISGEVAQIAYAVMIRAPSWIELALILGGIAFASVRRRRPGRSSAPRWHRSPATAPPRWPNG